MKKRNLNLDLIKCVAVFTVLSVHFFLNNGFYKLPIVGINMYVAVVFRTLFMVCVPLFMIATGYLMKNKKLSKKYYFGVAKVINIYLLASIVYFTYNIFYNNLDFTYKDIIKKILYFDIGYSWYVEMYIGLFLLIPFINLIYNNLQNKKEKQVLILTMLFLTSFQGIINIRHTLIPDWWTGIYPLTYYFIGCYLSEYKVNINKLLNIILFIVVLGISSIINIKLSYNAEFIWGIHNGWGSILNVFQTTLLFIFILNLKLENIPNLLKIVITKVSEYSFGLYLVSYVTDNLLYYNLFKETNLFSFASYFKIVPLSFIMSLIISMILTQIYNLIDKFIIKKLLNRV